MDEISFGDAQLPEVPKLITRPYQSGLLAKSIGRLIRSFLRVGLSSNTSKDRQSQATFKDLEWIALSSGQAAIYRVKCISMPLRGSDLSASQRCLLFEQLCLENKSALSAARPVYSSKILLSHQCIAVEMSLYRRECVMLSRGKPNYNPHEPFLCLRVLNMEASMG